MSKKGTNFQHFEAFLAVAAQHSFTAAAKQLGISTAAVSHTIRQLEASLKLSLFIRSTRRVILTDEGKLLLSQCQRLKNELQNTRSLIGQFKDKPSGQLTISSNPHFIESRLLSVLEQYMKKFPEVTINLISEERMHNMLEEKIDIIFGVNWFTAENVVAKTIDKSHYILCASPAYLEKFGTPQNIQELKEHHYIAHSGRLNKDLLIKPENLSAIELQPTLYLNSTKLMKRFALKGAGITQLHDYVVSDEIKSGELVELFHKELFCEISIYVYYHKYRFVQPKTREFIKLLNRK